MYIPSKFNKLKEDNILINANKMFIHPNNGIPGHITILSGGINVPKHKIYVYTCALINYPCHYSYINTDNNKQFAYAFKNAAEIIFNPTYQEYYKQYYKFIQYMPFQYPLSFNSRFPEAGFRATIEIYNEKLELINSFKGKDENVNVVLQNGPQIIYIGGYQDYGGEL